MSQLPYLLYDAEIQNCIPSKSEPRIEGLIYCGGWKDFIGMGVSVCGVYTSVDDRYYAFMPDNLHEMQPLVDKAETEGWEIVGFNSESFDDNLMDAHGIRIRTTYDLLCEVRLASGQPRQFVPRRSRPGYKLNAVAEATLKEGKVGSGELAPVLYQRGQIGQLITYNLSDLNLTKRLFEKRQCLVDPTNGHNLPPLPERSRLRLLTGQAELSLPS